MYCVRVASYMKGSGLIITISTTTTTKSQTKEDFVRVICYLWYISLMTIEIIIQCLQQQKETGIKFLNFCKFPKLPKQVCLLEQSRRKTTMKSIKVSGWCKYHQKIFLETCISFSACLTISLKMASVKKESQNTSEYQSSN